MGSHVKYPANVGKFVGLPGISTFPPSHSLPHGARDRGRVCQYVYIGIGLIDMQ